MHEFTIGKEYAIEKLALVNSACVIFVYSQGIYDAYGVFFIAFRTKLDLEDNLKILDPNKIEGFTPIGFFEVGSNGVQKLIPVDVITRFSAVNGHEKTTN